MNEDFVQTVNQIVQSHVRAGIQAFVDREVGRIKKDLNVPVEYVRGPRGGTLVIRSAEGEYPRREFGVLQGSVEAMVRDEGNTACEGEIGTNCVYAARLNFDLHRPFWDAAVDRVTDGGDELKNDIAKNFGVASPAYASST